MTKEDLESYISSNKIHTIPSSYWSLKYPDAHVLPVVLDTDEFLKKYPADLVDRDKTFNITFLFQREEFYNTNDIVMLCRFLFSSGYPKKYNVTFKFNYKPSNDLIRTFKIANISYVEHLDHDAYFGLLQNSHVILSIHRTNNSGVFLSEAALFGVPVISSPTGGSAQLFNQNNSILLKTKNADGGENFVPCHECLGGIFAYIDNSYHVLLRLAARARLMALRIHSKDSYIKKMQSIMEETE